MDTVLLIPPGINMRYDLHTSQWLKPSEVLAELHLWDEDAASIWIK